MKEQQVIRATKNQWEKAVMSFAAAAAAAAERTVTSCRCIGRAGLNDFKAA